jgi:hypothetical protein
MAVDLQELARRMLADYDARTPGRLFTEHLALTAVQAYVICRDFSAANNKRFVIMHITKVTIWPKGLI